MKDLFWDRQIFEGISEETKNKINSIHKRECTYNANELIIEEGAEIKDICIILEGVIKSTEYTSNGKELNSSYFFAGDAFPFYLIYGGIKRYFFNTYALKKSRVVWLPVDELIPIVNTDIKFMHNILKFVAEYNCDSKILLRGVQYRKVEDRLCYWLLHMNDPDEIVEIPNSQEVLADILHVSRSSLNQELVRLQKEGIIDFDRKNIKILNREYLEEQI